MKAPRIRFSLRVLLAAMAVVAILCVGLGKMYLADLAVAKLNKFGVSVDVKAGGPQLLPEFIRRTLFAEALTVEVSDQESAIAEQPQLVQTNLRNLWRVDHLIVASDPRSPMRISSVAPVVDACRHAKSIVLMQIIVDDPLLESLSRWEGTKLEVVMCELDPAASQGKCRPPNLKVSSFTWDAQTFGRIFGIPQPLEANIRQP